MDDPYEWLAHWAGRYAARYGHQHHCPYKSALAGHWRNGYRSEYFHPFIQELEGIDHVS